jgi:glycosyltransferase involved in cell wall biosynthesis
MGHLERQGRQRTFLFCSSIALYSPLLRVAEIITRDHRLDGHVIAPQECSVSSHSLTLWGCRPGDADPSNTQLPVHFLAAHKGDVERFGFAPPSLTRLLKQLKPDYIWIHEEFWQGIAQQILWHYRFKRQPRLVAYVAVNHIKQATPLFSWKYPFFSRTRLKQLLLWSRLDGVAACAGKSKECARRLGLPGKVPVVVNYLPVFGPNEAAGEGIDLPWPRGDSFIIGFAGLLSEQKGWKVLLAAVALLPPRFKVVLAGDGEQRSQLEVWLQRPGLQGRACYAGLLTQKKLLATYAQFDVLVLPSITTPHSVEQFGAVLAEAMACGVPVIGSDSGAIPETVGEAGLIVPEGDAAALAQAIQKMSADVDLRRQAITRGLERFRTHYSCESYARSLAEALFLYVIKPN